MQRLGVIQGVQLGLRLRMSVSRIHALGASYCEEPELCAHGPRQRHMHKSEIDMDGGLTRAAIEDLLVPGFIKLGFCGSLK